MYSVWIMYQVRNRTVKIYNIHSIYLIRTAIGYEPISFLTHFVALYSEKNYLLRRRIKYTFDQQYKIVLLTLLSDLFISNLLCFTCTICTYIFSSLKLLIRKHPSYHSSLIVRSKFSLNLWMTWWTIPRFNLNHIANIYCSVNTTFTGRRSNHWN